MAQRPGRICGHPGCGTIVRDGRFCQKHEDHARAYDRWRGSSTERGYDARWRRARLAYLHEHPLCRECEKQGKVVLAAEVDHIIPHRGNCDLFWDESNWQALCKSCHSAKTASGQ